MSGVGVLCTALGLLLTSASIFETWMAVLYPRAVTGPITALTYRVCHHISQRVLGPRSKLLLFSGPVLIVTQASVWATLLLLGVSLIVWPQLGVGHCQLQCVRYRNELHHGDLLRRLSR